MLRRTGFRLARPLSSSARIVRSVFPVRHHPLATKLANLHAELRAHSKNSSWVDVLRKNYHSDSAHLQEIEAHDKIQETLQRQIEQTREQYVDHFIYNKYQGKTLEHEEELNDRLDALQKQKAKFDAEKQDIHSWEYLALEAEILAVNRILNQNFSKMLVGTRADIAQEAIKVGERLGLDVYIIYTEQDETTPAVQSVAPERRILVSSYTNTAEILEKTKFLGKFGYFPGFAFLSEDPEAAKLIEQHGHKFIGPAKAMALFSNKALAKKEMAEAGVPIPPSYMGEDQRLETLLQEAKKIGYPVMVKQEMKGGGGKGNRKANNEAELMKAMEALKPPVTIEKFIANARHIELQVLNHFYFGGRNCSMAKDGQKGLEQFVDIRQFALLYKYIPHIMDRLQKRKYELAGTLEFLLSPEEQFYFMEMNTRLQVEHPVTNKALGIDLLELITRAALGRSVEVYLRKKFGISDKTLSAQYMLNKQMEKPAYPFIRMIRVLLVDVVKNPEEQRVAFWALKGTITKVKIPNVPHCNVSLGVAEGTKLDHIKYPMDPKYGYIIATGNTQLEADSRAARCYSELEVELDGRRLDGHAKFVCSTLAWLHTTQTPELIETWPEFEAHYSRQPERNFVEIMRDFPIVNASSQQAKVFDKRLHVLRNKLDALNRDPDPESFTEAMKARRNA